MNTRAKGNKMYHLTCSAGDSPTPEQLGAIEKGGRDAGPWRASAAVRRARRHRPPAPAPGDFQIHPTTFRMVEPYRDHYALRPPAGSSSRRSLQVDNGIPNGERLTAQARLQAHHASNLQRWRRASRSSGSKRLIGPMPRGSVHQALAGYSLEISRVVPGSWWWTATMSGCG